MARQPSGARVCSGARAAARLARPAPQLSPQESPCPAAPGPFPWPRWSSCGAPPPRPPRRRPTDGPGALSHFDLARKDCVGTARNTTSKVWFTVANGVLSDVYFPTNDNTNVETLQYLVTDGSTLHRPADARHDLHGPGDRRPRADVPRDQRRPRAGATRSSPTTRPTRRARRVLIHSKFVRAEGQAVATTASTSATTRRSTATAAAGPATAAPTTAAWPAPAATRCSSAPTPSRRPTPPTATTRSPCTRRSTSTAASPQATNGFAGTAQRRPRPARRGPHAHRAARHRRARQRRADGARALGHDGRLHARARLRRQQADAISASQRSLQRRLRRRAPGLRARLARLRRQARRAAAPERRLVRRTGATSSTSTTSAPTT